MYHFSVDKEGVKRNSTFGGLEEDESKMCVVSLIGKSRLDRYRMKSGVFNNFIKTDIFAVDGNNSKSNCFIEGYYHKSGNVLFLHLVSRSDTLFRMELYRKWLKEESVKDHGEYIREANHDYLRALIFVFSVSHVILINEPGSSFDITYIRLFKNLDVLRTKLQPIITKLFSTNCPDLSKSWMEHARPCSPRVLFLFETCLLSTDLGNEEGEPAEPETVSKTKNKKAGALRDLQRAIEEMIYKVFRKDRIITNISTNSLLSIPANKEFVYILSEDELSSTLFDPTQHYSSLLSEACSWPENQDISRRPFRHSSLRQPTSPHQLHSPNQQTSGSSLSSQSPDFDIPSLLSSRIRCEDEDLRNFIKSHIDLALKKGFDDNIGRVSVEPLFELPSMKMFIKVVEALHGLLWANVADPEAQKTFQNFFENHIDLDLKFSEVQCSKVFIQVMALYQNDLPEFYNKKHHLMKLNEVKQYFMVHARGPCVSKYLTRLEQDCLKIWKDGRRSCETVSMKGNPCCNQLHRSREDLDSDSNLPVMGHKNGIVTKSTCNCGKFQAERNDPFDHRVANLDFFQQLEEKCCSRLEHYKFSIYTPSSSSPIPLDVCSPLSKYNSQLSLTPQSSSSKTSSKFLFTSFKNDLKLTSDDALEMKALDGLSADGKDTVSADGKDIVSADGKDTVSADEKDILSSLLPSVHEFKLKFIGSSEQTLSPGDYQPDGLKLEDEDNDDDDDDDDLYFKHNDDGFDRDFQLSQRDEIIDEFASRHEEVTKKREVCLGDDEEKDGEENGPTEISDSDSGDDGDNNDNDADRDKENSKTNYEEDEDDDDDDGEGEDEGEEIESEGSNEEETKEEDSNSRGMVDLMTTTGRTTNNDSDQHADSFSDTELSEQVEQKSSKMPLLPKYLVGMLNNDSPRGLLPLFSSWSLVRLGKYASYECSTGIDQPGFTHQTNYLLPIDVKLQAETKDTWTSSPLKTQKKTSVRILRLYLGLEYECSKAHRFMLASPTKMLKLPPGGVLKETGSKIVNNDMPLYFPCSCRSNSSQMGQLMRIHVAVPDSGLEVKLKVRVQPGPSLCPIFYPEGGESITLKTGLWVLRLPYVYFDGSRSYNMPSDQKHLSSCRLLKGCLTALEK